MATLTRFPKGPTVGSILLLMATCYAAYAALAIVPTHHTWNLLSSKWVFKIKVDENGVITRSPKASSSVKE
jgi:hypothetical protein